MPTAGRPRSEAAFRQAFSCFSMHIHTFTTQSLIIYFAAGSDALWSAAVERERVIAALVAAPQVSRSVVEEAAQELELSRKSSIVWSTD
jgi:hypothetical protein